MKHTDSKAFTLVEIMVVVILIGILASFAIPRYNKTVERSHKQDAETQLIAVHGANNIYRAQTGSFFGTIGTNYNITQINANLDLNLIANGMTYSYRRTAASTYLSTAVRNAPASVFTITVTQNPIDTTGGNPACSGACP
ncbi:MAG: prepilin-type N-terminal cleavage/methylation domain-containing protein [Candidatus Omnitrophota bacterium]